MEEFTLKPVKSGNQVIGWLGLHRNQHRSDPFATVFPERQPKFFCLAVLRAEIEALQDGIGKLVDDLHLLSLADSRGPPLDLDIEGSATAEMPGDPDRLKQVFSNVLDNTLRHADVPGKLRISARSTGTGTHRHGLRHRIQADFHRHLSLPRSLQTPSRYPSSH